MSYFADFPKIKYPYQGKLVGDKTDPINRLEVTDLMIRYKIKDEVLKNPLSYYEYFVKDNQRPDQIAALYYGDSEFAWLVMLSGSLFDWIGDLPMSQRVFDEYLEKKYNKTIFELQTEVKEYRDENGFVIDQETYLQQAGSSSIIDTYTWEAERNESKRKIKLISRIYLETVNKELLANLREIEKSRRTNLGEFIL